MNALTPTGRPVAAPIANALLPSNLGEAMKLAEFMARGSLVPQHLRNPADCLAVIEQAMRWNMSPFAVAQGMFNVKGKNGYAGALIHAAVEQNAPVQGHLSYHFSGEGETRAVTVRGTLIGETEPREVVVKLRDARTSNEWWAKTPDQMLCYHGARVWARRHTPQVIFGAYSREELLDSGGVDEPAPLPPARGPVMDATPEPDLVIVDGEGNLRSAPNVETWKRWCMKAVAARAERGREALWAWWQAMEPHMEAAPRKIVEDVRAAVEERLDIMGDVSEPGA